MASDKERVIENKNRKIGLYANWITSRQLRRESKYEQKYRDSWE